MQSLHSSTAELAGVKLRLREDLSFTVRPESENATFLIEDEYNSKFYRIGLSEYTFLSLLDGHTSVAEAIGRTAAALGDRALSEPDAAALCKWLIDMQLASTEESRDSGRLREASDRAKKGRFWSRLNPITPKIPLLNPDSLLGVLTRMFGWLFDPRLIVAWLILVLIGLFLVMSKWQQFSTSAPQIFARENWLWLALSWILLKLLHETAHGIVCKRYGGVVRETGILFILLVPLPYVDVTSAWRFRSKWHRIFMSAAGMYAEAALASLAVIVWSCTAGGLLHQHAYNVILTAGCITLLFNANPLMRFDGYYILTDWLDLPNLSANGNRFLLQFGRKHLFGLPANYPQLPKGKAWIVRLYGVAALVWRILVCVGLAWVASRMFHGAGIVLALIAIGIWVLLPLSRLIRFILLGSKTEQPNRIRFATILASSLAIGVAVCMWVPWFGKVHAPAIVDYDPLLEIRSSVSGFIRAVEVTDGETVEKNQVLLVLDNPELNARIRALEADIAIAEQRARMARNAQEIAALQVEEENLRTLRERHQEKRFQADNLIVRAPERGIVIIQAPDALEGLYVDPGEKLMSLGPDGKKRVHALVSQDGLEAFQSRVGQTVNVQIWGMGTDATLGILEEINPDGSTQLRHHALSATAGGPLAVRMNSPEQNNGEESLSLLTPHFSARVRLIEPTTQDLLPGRLGQIAFTSRRGTIGEVLRDNLLRWYRQNRDTR